MRHVTRLCLFTLAALCLSVTAASAATTAAQLVELARAGLTDDILIALIQTDGSTFQLTAADILALHQQGLSNRVILAMQETAKRPAPAPAPEPSVVAPTPPIVVEPVAPQPPPAPAVVNVYQNVTQETAPAPTTPYVPYYNQVYGLPVYVVGTPVKTPQVTQPVYWGWGGQRRPDTWAPDPPRQEPTPQNPPSRIKGGK